jgi:hypothetical protein
MIWVSHFGLVLFTILSTTFFKECLMEDQLLDLNQNNSAIAFLVSEEKGVLTLTWHNLSNQHVPIATHVFAGENHFDWITVKLINQSGETRVLRFFENRDESAVIIADLAPGMMVHETLDLNLWAVRAINGKLPLASGIYQAEVLYNTQHAKRYWSGQLKASLQITIP